MEWQEVIVRVEKRRETEMALGRSEEAFIRV